jgi:hypothetical protein
MLTSTGTLEYQEFDMEKDAQLKTLVSEESSLLAMYLRNEKNEWIPRVGITQ